MNGLDQPILFTPRPNARRFGRMVCQPALDRFSPCRVELTIGIGVEIEFSDVWRFRHHRPFRTGGVAIPSMAAESRDLARERRDITVPIGICSESATS
mgnify:CR=1 FL=1